MGIPATCRLIAGFKKVKRMRRRESKEKPGRMRSAAVTAAARKRFEAKRSVFFMVFSTCRIF